MILHYQCSSLDRTPAALFHFRYLLWFIAVCNQADALPLRTKVHGGLHSVLAEGNATAALLATAQWRFSAAVAEAPQNQNLACGGPVIANSGSHFKARCPQNCPLVVEDKSSAHHCDFHCVEASHAQCVAVDPVATVADEKLGVCRSCVVDGCKTCTGDGTDRCAECFRGYFRSKGGSCISKTTFLWWVVIGLASFLVLLIIAWIANLALRPSENPEGLEEGLAVRSRAKLQKPKWMEHETEEMGRRASEMSEMGLAMRRSWELDTNLTKTSVGGAGMLLHFNFQVAVIGWAVIAAVAWTLMALYVDKSFLWIGLRTAHTPYHHCVLVADGYEKQRRLMKFKVAFILALYLFSFILAIAHGIRQLRLFQIEDQKLSTHKDFCIEVNGLPVSTGDQPVEADIKVSMEEALGQRIVGVSVCWNFEKEKWVIMRVIEDDLYERGDPAPLKQPRMSEKVRRMSQTGFMTRVFAGMERIFMHPTTQRIITKGRNQSRTELRRANLRRHGVHLGVRARKQCVSRPVASRFGFAEVPEDETGVESDTGVKEGIQSSAMDGSKSESSNMEIDMDEVLAKMKNTGKAFVVFHTEAERDDALRVAEESGGMQFRGVTLNLKASEVEPDSVAWQNCVSTDRLERIWRLLTGIIIVLAAQLTWGLFFYLPYAYYAVKFDYTYGTEPNFSQSMIFTIIIAFGNALMYIVCGEVSDRIGFYSIDRREVCYMVLYTCTCVLNIALDLVITYYVGYYKMVGMKQKNYYGTPLADMSNFSQRFESFPMQRELGQALFWYCFPATFLVPFVLEPLFAMYLPYRVMGLIVRGDTHFRGGVAEACMGAVPMDLSRYGDILLNLVLAVLVFLFPGGYTLPLFSCLALSHIWIYGYDHWRVLRSIPACSFCNMTVDWWAQWMLCLPLGLLLASAVFKSNCEDGFQCVPRDTLIFRCLAVFASHILLHTLVLHFFVPMFGIKEKSMPAEEYKDCGRRIACSWFSANPVHCLRSKFVYGDQPPCDFCAIGKEHLMKVNHSIGQHFEDGAVAVEDYPISEIEFLRGVSRRISHLSIFSALSRGGSASWNVNEVKRRDQVSGASIGDSEWPGDKDSRHPSIGGTPATSSPSFCGMPSTPTGGPS